MTGLDERSKRRRQSPTHRLKNADQRPGPAGLVYMYSTLLSRILLQMPYIRAQCTQTIRVNMFSNELETTPDALFCPMHLHRVYPVTLSLIYIYRQFITQFAYGHGVYQINAQASGQWSAPAQTSCREFINKICSKTTGSSRCHLEFDMQEFF